MKKSFISPWLAVVAFLFALGGCASNARQESVGEFVDDAVITVSDTREYWKAAQLARNVKGVKAVRNDLAVK